MKPKSCWHHTTLTPPALDGSSALPTADRSQNFFAFLTASSSCALYERPPNANSRWSSEHTSSNSGVVADMSSGLP